MCYNSFLFEIFVHILELNLIYYVNIKKIIEFLLSPHHIINIYAIEKL